MWVVYLLKCRNNILYTGISNNLKNRISKHNLGKGARTTARLAPCELVWHEHRLNRSDAQKREHEIKKWRREKKLALIENGLT